MSDRREIDLRDSHIAGLKANIADLEEEAAYLEDALRRAREIIEGCVTILIRYRGSKTPFDPHERALIIKTRTWLIATARLAR